jgi:hypothetical protein
MIERAPAGVRLGLTGGMPVLHYLGVYRVFTVYFDPSVVHNLFKLCYPAYFVMTPQAMRSPAFPAGSVFMSSAWA